MFTLKMTQTLTKAGAIYAGPDIIVRPNLSADMLAVLIKAGDSLLKEWTAAQKGGTSYYYVRGEQSDGELVWVSPMWITYR